MTVSIHRKIVLTLAVSLTLLHLFAGSFDLTDPESPMAYYQIVIESMFSGFSMILVSICLIAGKEGTRLEQIALIAVTVSLMANLALTLGWIMGRVSPPSEWWFMPLIPATGQVLYLSYYLRRSD